MTVPQTIQVGFITLTHSVTSLIFTVLSIVDLMDIGEDSVSTLADQKISTHGPRGSRREQWRTSKGLDPIPKRRGMNRQGGIAARRKSGRSSRRR